MNAAQLPPVSFYVLMLGMAVVQSLVREVSNFLAALPRWAEEGLNFLSEQLEEGSVDLLATLGSLVCGCVNSENPDPITRAGDAVPGFQTLLQEQGVLDVVFQLAEQLVKLHKQLIQQTVLTIQTDTLQLIQQIGRMSYRVLTTSCQHNASNRSYLSRFVPTMVEHTGLFAR